MDKLAFITEEFRRRKNLHLMRRLRSVVPLSGARVSLDNKEMINFSSNDYLGLAQHPLLKERAMEYMERYGSGATASRLICGHYECFDLVEEKLAVLKKTEKAMILNSGFQTNVSVLPALTDPGALILSDRLNHNSIVQGALLSRCRVIKFAHNDLEDLERHLKENQRNQYSRILIVTESVFSADGDVSDVGALADLAVRFNALLIIDEAHATGVTGRSGMGLTCGENVDLVIGTFGKACGSFGSYIASSERMVHYLVNCCNGFIYTTALPPPVVGAIDAALELIPQMDEQREILARRAEFLRSSLKDLGWDTGRSVTQIIPVVIGDEEETLRFSQWLEDNGILAVPMRPPTVEPGLSRIRLTLSALHTREQVEYLIDVFEKWGQEENIHNG